MDTQITAAALDGSAVTGLARAIKVVGSIAGLASELGESTQTVWNWKSRGVPAERCPDIERITLEKGERVPCEEIRDDVDWSVLRKSGRK